MASFLYFTLLLCLIGGLWNGATAEGQEQPGDDECCERCPPGWTHFGDHCYQFHFTEKDWADAEISCVAVGGNLASIHNKEQYDFIREIIMRATGTDKQTWIGGEDAEKEGVWMWSDGRKFDFKFWGKGEPNNFGGSENCLGINYGGNGNDITCQQKNSFVCGRRLW